MSKSRIYLIIIAASLALQGCTARNMSAGQEYRPKGADKAWRISGAIATDYEPILGIRTPTELLIHINGDQVIKGTLSGNYTGELSGEYKNHDIQAICTSEPKTINWIQIRCVILVDNEKATTLTF